MRWRMTMFCMLLSGGCSAAQPVAARVAPLVPRLEVRLLAQDAASLETRALRMRQQHGWDVVVVANLRWRTSSRPWGQSGSLR